METATKPLNPELATFDNLAPASHIVATRNCAQELLAAGISRVFAESEGEVRSDISGMLLYPDGCHATFTRFWTYWSVSARQPLPSEIAQDLNERCGTIVRAEGHAGGLSSLPASGVQHWHVDTAEGLKMLVEALKKAFGEPIPVEENFVSNMFSEPSRLKPLSNGIRK